jgi:hypothetical protein
MKKLTERYGTLIIISFFIMAIGLILFLLTPLLYTRWGFDSDIPGAVLFCAGVALCTMGIIRRKKPQGWRLVILVALVVLFLLPIVQLAVSTIYFLITRKPVGG